MPGRRNLLAKQALEIERHIARTRELVAESLDALRSGVPDTFLGRKTQEPFPKDQTRRGEATPSNSKPT